MPIFDKSKSPYYDNYDPSKQYTHLLAVPGRAAQAREITQIQSTMKDIIKNIGDSIYRDGDVVEGCQVSVRTAIDEDGNSYKYVTVSDGKVYINGMVLTVALGAERNFKIEGKGYEYVGFELEEKVITHKDDKDFLDQAEGFDNYLKPGCDRIKSTVNILVGREDRGANLVTLLNGEIFAENSSREYSKINEVLAERTYDESGSYVVEGLRVSVADHESIEDESLEKKENYFVVKVDAGKSYIKGYSLATGMRKITVPRSLDTRPDSYTATTKLPFYDISSVSYEKDVAYIDSVTAPCKFEIEEINSDSEGKIYLTDTDLDQYLGEYGDAQTGGESIVVTNVKSSSDTPQTYSYSNGVISDLTPGVPYNIECYAITKLKDDYYSLVDNQKLVWDNNFYENVLANVSSGLLWVVTAQILRYQARKDIVYIDKSGTIDVVLGTPAEYGYEDLPQTPTHSLALAYIMNPPGGIATTMQDYSAGSITVSNIGLTRFTMRDIQKLIDRISRIEYDQASLALDEEATQYPIADKKGIFTDPLKDFSKVDLYKKDFEESVNNNFTDPVKYKATIDATTNLCYLPTLSDVSNLVLNTEKSDINQYTRAITLKVKDTNRNVVRSQKRATKTFLVNPYSQFPQTPRIHIDPATDNWIDDNIIPVYDNLTGDTIYLDGGTKYTSEYDTRGSVRPSTSRPEFIDTEAGTKVETIVEESIVEQAAIKYIRENEINIKGTLFKPDGGNITCYFDGKKMELIGDNKIDSNGEFSAKIKIPGGTFLTGIKEVKVVTDQASTANFQNTAYAVFQASGTLRTINRTVTTLTTLVVNRVTNIITTNYIDPIGQTFILDRPTLVSAVNLYFAAKPGNNGAPIICDIREVVDGNITSTVYGTSVLSPSRVNAVNIASEDVGKGIELLPTTFVLEDPVLLDSNKEYAIVAISESDEYSVWVSDLGETDVVTGERVLSNPAQSSSGIGVMMSSSNNFSWTIHQTTDMKFDLLEDVYEDKSIVYFNEVDLSDNEQLDYLFSRIILSVDTILPGNSRVNWSYKESGSTTYSSITPEIMKILSKMSNKIEIKAELYKDTMFNLSPMIVKDTVSLKLSRFQQSGYYLSKRINNVDSYTDVKVILDACKYSGGDGKGLLEIYVIYDEDKQIKKIGGSPTKRTINSEWDEVAYSLNLGNTPANSFRLLIRLSNTDNYEYVTPAFRRLRVILS